MPGLAFEDDEEPGGHVTQHEEQLPPPDPLSQSRPSHTGISAGSFTTLSLQPGTTKCMTLENEAEVASVDHI